MNGKTIDDRVLERYLLNELPGDQIKEINRRLESDGDLKQRVAQLKESNNAILDRYPPESQVREILDRLDRHRREELIINNESASASAGSRVWGKPKWLLIASPALAAVLVFFIFFPLTKPVTDPTDTNPIPIGDTRIKGTQSLDMSKPNLLVYRKVKDHAEILKQGVNAKAGDLLQLAYTVPDAIHGVILSIDGNAAVTLHFPGDVKGSTQLEANQKILLENAYELDDAPGFERFFFITAHRAIDVESVMKGAKDLARHGDHGRSGTIRWNHPDHLVTSQQTSILIIKGDES
ncbi:MAG: hypothetical protein GY940_03855 [bacterium]|nr:hypothetical protein [bacterium]